MGLIREGLFLAQIMVHHKAYIREKALNNELVICDTFVVPSNFRNLAKKRTNELW
jgi:thymidylate kinase